MPIRRRKKKVAARSTVSTRVSVPALTSTAPGYSAALTGLRGLAAGLVFLHHYFGQWFWQHPWSSILSEGYVGVTVFFTLSGFLITRTYLERFEVGTIRFGEYWFRRFARVYPPYLLLLAIVLVFFRQPTGLGQVIANVTLMQAFFFTHLWSGIAAAWSLTSEECFYLMAPPIFWGLSRLRGLAPRLAALAALSVALWYGGRGIVAAKPAGDFLTSDFYMRIYTIFGRFPEFAIGMAVALLVMRWPKWVGRATPLRRWLTESAFALFILSIVACFWLMVRLREPLHENYGINTPWGVPTLWMLAVGTGLCIWSCTRGSRLAQVLLGNRAVEYLGRISYVFYLLQERSLSDYVLGVTGDNPLLAYAGLNLCAAALYEVVEKPVHRWLLKRYPVPLVKKRLPSKRRKPKKKKS